MSKLGLTVKKALREDVGRDYVRLHRDQRGDSKRHEVVKVTISDTKKALLACVLGHNEHGTIWLDLDARAHLDVEADEKYEFSIETVGVIGRLCWYLNARSPAVRIPARLAVFSVVLGIFSIVLAIIAGCK